MKRLFSKIIYHPLGICCITAFVLLIILQNTQRLKRLDIAKQNIKQAEEKVEAVETEFTKIENLLEEAQEPLAQERIVRDSLLMQKNNELVIKLPEINVVFEEDNQEKEVSNWQAWIKLIFS